jgi:RIO kinase 2
LHYILFARREDSIDVEVAASGFTKEMDEDLCDEILRDKSDEVPEEDDEGTASESESVESEDAEQHAETPAEKVEESLPDEAKEVPIDTLHAEVLDSLANMNLDRRVHLTSTGGGGDDSVSVSGFSMISRSTAATIAPEVIKGKIRKSFEKGDKMNARRRIRAKGEASATTRSRRANSENIKHSHGIWGWE